MRQQKENLFSLLQNNIWPQIFSKEICIDYYYYWYSQEYFDSDCIDMRQLCLWVLVPYASEVHAAMQKKVITKSWLKKSSSFSVICTGHQIAQWRNSNSIITRSTYLCKHSSHPNVVVYHSTRHGSYKANKVTHSLSYAHRQTFAKLKSLSVLTLACRFCRN